MERFGDLSSHTILEDKEVDRQKEQGRSFLSPVHIITLEVKCLFQLSPRNNLGYIVYSRIEVGFESRLASCRRILA